MIISALNETKNKNESLVKEEVSSYLEYLKVQFMMDFKLTIDYFGNSSKSNDKK